MTTYFSDSSQGDVSVPFAPYGLHDHQFSRYGNKVFRSGPLFLSSKGIGWTSWKKRWFILTRTSLVFFRSDPNSVPLKGGQVNLTLGGIDLNNSGSVVVKEDKRLLTVLFSDGRDGRAFTLKAVTLEDLREWKTALENALARSPNAAVVGQSNIFQNEQDNADDDSFEQVKDKLHGKYLVVGRPILLALEDIDGTPSFLEKALRFIEEQGIEVEGILRQAADVEDVERRVRDYEQGKVDFSPSEDPHIIADCVKHVLRELPSPVPTSCCNALLVACRTERSSRVTAMRAAICETFPEPNLHLLQRILMMMRTVASHKAQNRMSSSAVAACMAPLLLRPLLSGDCELENNFDVCGDGDGSLQLLKAAAAANHAQTIVITLLEEYDKIFGEDSETPDLFSDSLDSESESEEQSDDDDESFENDEYDDQMDEFDEYTDDLENASSGTYSESDDCRDEYLCEDKSIETSSLNSKNPDVGHDFETTLKLPSNSSQTSLPEDVQVINLRNQSHNSLLVQRANESDELLENIPVERTMLSKLSSQSLLDQSIMHPAVWIDTPGRNDSSRESIEYRIKDEDEIQRLEDTKTELQNMIEDEVKMQKTLQESLVKRKWELHERRLALENDVARLQEQLQLQRDLTMTLEAGIIVSQGLFHVPSTDEKTQVDHLKQVALAGADVTNFKQKFDDLELQLKLHRQKNHAFECDSISLSQQNLNQHMKPGDKQKDSENMVISQLCKKSAKSKVNQDGVDSESTKKHGPSTLLTKALPNKQTPQTQKFPSNSSISETMISKPPANYKKSRTRAEGTNSTTSTLTKITTRLNFLKERRSQIKNELEKFDKCQKSIQTIQNLDMGGGSTNNTVVTEGDLLQTPEKLKKLEICAGKTQEKGGKRSDSPTVGHMDRGRSGGQHLRNTEKD